MELGMAS